MTVCNKIRCLKMPIVGNLDSYIRAVNILPLLSLEEERYLSLRFYRYGDLSSFRMLILSHLRFVIHITKNYYGYGLLYNDLIQEGNIGLMKALRRFNPIIGVRLVSFAIHWIKSEIHEYVLRNWRIVKVATTKSQRKLFFNLRRIKKKIGWFNIIELNVVAKKLNVNSNDVQEMEKRMFSKDITFNPFPLQSSIFKKNNKITIHYLKDNNSNFSIVFEKNNWFKYINNKLIIALNRLDKRSRNIIHSRWLYDDNTRKITLKKMAEYYGISAERVRQLEKNAMKKLRIAIEK